VYAPAALGGTAALALIEAGRSGVINIIWPSADLLVIMMTDFASMNGNPKISVIIPTYNRAEHLRRTIRYLLDQSDAPEHEILVIDDGSTDSTLELIHEFEEKLAGKLRRIPAGHHGPAAARNLGIIKARGNIIAMIDDDCLPEPDWLANLIRGFEKDDRLAGIGGQTLPVDDTNIWSRFQDLFAMRKPHEDGSGITFLLTNNAAFRRDHLIEIGGFDETFPAAAGEDVDLCMRLRAKGYTLGYEPKARIRHHNITTFAGYLKMCWRYGQGEVIIHRFHPAWHKILRTLWWSRHLLAWLRIPSRAVELARERQLGWQDSLAFAAMISGQHMISFLASLSMPGFIVRGERRREAG
jgi:glycosyltransferase involved in cell wall biosynthesis